MPDAILIYAARGAAGACGVNCSDWIAAEGTVHWDGHKRVIAALDRLAGRKLPMFLNVRGASDIRVALGVGRVLRERGLDVAVGNTLVGPCSTISETECVALKRSGVPLQASIAPLQACDIACVLILAGGVRRSIADETTVVIHGTQVGHRLGLNVPDEIRDGVHARSNDQIKVYLTRMGVDPALGDMIDANYGNSRKTVLSRADLVRLRVVTSQ